MKILYACIFLITSGAYALGQTSAQDMVSKLTDLQTALQRGIKEKVGTPQAWIAEDYLELQHSLNAVKAALAKGDLSAAQAQIVSIIESNPHYTYITLDGVALDSLLNQVRYAQE